jgi:hypothetical protein
MNKDILRRILLDALESYTEGGFCYGDANEEFVDQYLKLLQI